MSVILKIKHTDIAGTCFICGANLDHVTADDDGDEYHDTWTCDECDILITFITPSKAATYGELSKCWMEVTPAAVRKHVGS